MTHPWPWPGDTPIARARRVALSYRDALAAADPQACRALDERMRRVGQRWVVPQPVTYGEDDLLTAELAADYAGVALKTVYEWRRRGLASRETPDGIRFRFADLQTWLGKRRP